ncbi:hypothetical protein CEXT_213831 [Caerostris extrusa]|uniref:Uncharacterized protein n=1 Tax=Caerostris extrusa TaxID=172846 RepID=A0AAV4V4B1_CAEEX|nr:hypothetical protein CEXT_213831 [Caerostris extrusa]
MVSPNKKSEPQNSSSSEEDSGVSSALRCFRSPAVDESANRFFRSLNETAPRYHDGEFPLLSRNLLPTLLYEGMSSEDLKKCKSSKTSLRRDDSTSRRSFLHRRNSRRSSLRKPRLSSEKDNPPPASPAKKEVVPKGRHCRSE